MIKQLSIGVSSSDQSYMPQYVVVLVGRQPADLHEIKETRIQAYDDSLLFVFYNQIADFVSLVFDVISIH